MPELVDVEAFRRVLAEHGTGRSIEHVRAPRPDVIRNTTPQGVGRALRHHVLASPTRHGKWVLAPTEDGPALGLHFGMTGALLAADSDEPLHRHDRFVLRLDDGEIRYRNMRMLGGVWLAHSADELDEITGDIGPDAEGMDAEALRERVEAARGALKPALMDQRRVAGLGNLLVDETLWRARLAPRLPVRELSGDDWERLAETIQGTLRAAMPAGRVPDADDWLTGARAEEDPHCPRCGAALRRAKVGGRTTYWCPACQPG